MRKYIILLFISAFALGACDKNDDYTVREWTVASQLGISHGFHTLQPVLLVKANDDTSCAPYTRASRDSTTNPDTNTNSASRPSSWPNRRRTHRPYGTRCWN